MNRREYQKGDIGENNVLLSGLGGFAIKTSNSKVGLNILHLQNGEKKSGIFDFIGSDQGSDFISFQHGLDYSQRSMTNLLLMESTSSQTINGVLIGRFLLHSLKYPIPTFDFRATKLTMMVPSG